MPIKFYFMKVGMDSNFSLLAKPWFYRSQSEDYFIVRLCGIYFWFYRKNK